MTETTALNGVVEQMERIQRILKESPEVLTFLNLIKETGVPAMVTPLKSDVLIEASEAAKVLKVSTVKIGQYHSRGLLPAYFVPDSNHRKFWLSDVMSIAKQEIKKSTKVLSG